MKYKPRNSNFEYHQHEIAEELLAARNKLEDIKDAIAKVIDEYVDDIITSHLDAKQLVVHAQDGRVSIQYWLSETEREDGITDLFNVSTPLNVILSELRDRLSDENDAELADNTAALLESIAAECRAEAATIRQQQ